MRQEYAKYDTESEFEKLNKQKVLVHTSFPWLNYRSYKEVTFKTSLSPTSIFHFL